MLRNRALFFTSIVLLVLSACSGGGSDAGYDNGNAVVTRSIVVTPEETEVLAGDTVQYTASAVMSDGSESDVTAVAVWSAANEAIASIGATGRASALAAGETKVSAFYSTADGVFGDDALLRVVEPEVASFQINPPRAIYFVGTTQDYQAIISYADGRSENVTFNADWALQNDPPILAAYQPPSAGVDVRSTVDEYGTAIAVDEGVDTLTATFNGLKAESEVIVLSKPALLKLSIEPRSETIISGTQLQYTAIAIYDGNKKIDVTRLVTWNSSRGDIARVSNSSPSRGLTLGVTPGITTISATLEGLSDSTALRVVAPTITRIDVFPPDWIMDVEDTVNYSAIAYLNNQTSQDITQNVVWSSTGDDVAVVSNVAGSIGRAQGVSSGVVTISAGFSGVIGSARLEITETSPVRIVIEPSVNTMVSLTTDQYTATAVFSSGAVRDVTDVVVWLSTDESIVQVSNSADLGKGKAFALKPGSTTIRVQLGVRGTVLAGQAEVTVIAPSPDADLQISPPLASVLVGDTQRYLARFIVNGALFDVTDRVTWTSDNTAAHIDQTGLATGESEGIVNIQATLTLAGSTWSDIAVLEVKSPAIEIQELVVSPPAAEILIGTSQQYTARAVLSDGTEIPVTNDVDWFFTDNAVAQIDENGLAVAAAEGEGTVAATLLYGGVEYKGRAALKVVAPEVTVEELVVSPPLAKILVAGTQSYSATVRLNNGNTADVTNDVSWLGSDPGVATISLGGVASGISVGIVEIKAVLSYQGGVFEDTASLEVAGPTVDSVQVTPKRGETLERGGTFQFAATAILSDLSSVDVTNDSVWFIGDEAIGKINNADQNGLATGLQTGTTAVWAEFTYQGVTYPCQGVSSCQATFAVLPLEVAQLQVLPPQAEIIEGGEQSYQAFAILNNDDSLEVTDRVSWRSSDTAIASIDGLGLATGVSPGEVTITAQGESEGEIFEGSAALIVSEQPVTVDQIVVTPFKRTIPIGAPLPYTAVALLSTGRRYDITTISSWSSSLPGVADINPSTGLATGIAPGTSDISARITYQEVEYSGQTSLSVTDVSLTRIEVAPAIESVAVDGSTDFVATAILSNTSKVDITELATWAADDTEVASVASGGTTTGHSGGSTRIRANLSYLGLEFLCDDACSAMLQVMDPLVPKSLQVTPVDGKVVVGSTILYKADLTLNNGEVRDVTADVAWASSNPDVAERSRTEPNGEFEGISAGMVDITAAFINGEIILRDTVSLNVQPEEVVLEYLLVEPQLADTYVTGTVQYEAFAHLSNDEVIQVTDDVTWASLDRAVAAIEPTTGLAVGLSLGEATITASFNLQGVAYTDEAALTVRIPQQTGLRVLPSVASEPVGGNQAFIAELLFEDGSNQIVTSTVIWSSGNSPVAAISNSPGTEGLATALAEGLTVITAEDPGGLSGTAELTVTAAQLLRLLVDPPSLILPVLTSGEFTALAEYTDNTVADVTTETGWSSEDSTTAVVSNGEEAGRVEAVAVGSTIVNATFSGVTTSAAVEVVGDAIKDIVILPDGATIAAQVNQQFRAYAVYISGIEEEITEDVVWLSSVPQVAYISNLTDSRGFATALSSGTTMISANFGGLPVDPVTLIVQDVDLQEIKVLPETASANLNQDVLYNAVGIYNGGLTADLTFIADWQSSNPGVADIVGQTEASRIVSTAMSGNTQIQAQVNSLVGSGRLDVISLDCGQNKPDSIFLANQTTVLGGYARFMALAIYPDGCEQDISGRSNTKFLITNGSSNVCTFPDKKYGDALGTGLGSTQVSASWGTGNQETIGFATCTVVAP